MAQVLSPSLLAPSKQSSSSLFLHHSPASSVTKSAPHCNTEKNTGNKSTERRKRSAVRTLLMCYDCGKISSSAYNHRVHMKVHGHVYELFVCRVCGRDFQYKNSFLVHQSTHLAREESLTAAPVDAAPEALGSSGPPAIPRALKAPSGTPAALSELPSAARLKVCSFCPASFYFQSDLAKHENIHTGERLFPCPDCPKTFLHQTSLRLHLRTHADAGADAASPAKSYECSHCGLRMNDASNMRVHERIHTGLKPFACAKCGKAFSRSTDLRQHESVHTDDKPFRCKACDKSFKSKKGWQKHERNVHRGQPEKTKLNTVCSTNPSGIETKDE